MATEGAQGRPRPKGVRCPTCREPVSPDAPEFPFCSRRCRFVDLGNWLEERYRIPSGPRDDEDDGGDGGADVGERDDVADR